MAPSTAWALTLLLACTPHASEGFAAWGLRLGSPHSSAGNLAASPPRAARTHAAPLPGVRAGKRGAVWSMAGEAMGMPKGTDTVDGILDETSIAFPFGKSFVLPGARERFEIHFGEYNAGADKPWLNPMKYWKIFSSETYVCGEGEGSGEECIVWVDQKEDESLHMYLKVPDEVAPRLRMSGVEVIRDRWLKFETISIWWRDGELTVKAKLPKDPPIVCEAL